MKRRLLILAFATAAIVVWAAVDAIDVFNDAAFDEQTWKQSRNDERRPMARAVVKLAAQPGMTRDSIEQLLGPPEVLGREDAGGNRLPGVETLSYYVGNGGLFDGMDDAFVYIHLNDAGEVIDASIDGY